jgi:hypothetical protein
VKGGIEKMGEQNERVRFTRRKPEGEWRRWVLSGINAVATQRIRDRAAHAFCSRVATNPGIAGAMFHGF